MRTATTNVLCDSCGRTATVDAEFGPAVDALTAKGWGFISTKDRDLCPACYRGERCWAMGQVRNSLGGIVQELLKKNQELKDSYYWKDLYWLEKTEDSDIVFDAIDSLAFATTICARAHAVLVERINALKSAESDDGSSAPSSTVGPCGMDMCLRTMGERFVKAYESMTDRSPSPVWPEGTEFEDEEEDE